MYDGCLSQLQLPGIVQAGGPVAPKNQESSIGLNEYHTMAVARARLRSVECERRPFARIQIQSPRVIEALRTRAPEENHLIFRGIVDACSEEAFVRRFFALRFMPRVLVELKEPGISERA